VRSTQRRPELRQRLCPDPLTFIAAKCKRLSEVIGKAGIVLAE
jgi:hypothetical protein